MSKRIIAAFAGMALATTVLNTTASVLVTNGDMELNALTGFGDFSFTPPTGWLQGTGVSGTLGTIGEDRVSVSADITTPTDFAWLHLQGINNEGGQSIGDLASNLGQTITISYDVTKRNNEDDNWNHRVRLYAGDGSGWTASSDTATPGTGDFLAEATVGMTGDSSAGEVINNTLQILMPSSYAGSGTDLYLAFKNRAGASAQLHIDDVSAIIIIPEPSTLVLAGTGLLALLRRRR